MQFPPPDSWCLKKNKSNYIWGELAPGGYKGILCMCGPICVENTVRKVDLFSSYEEAEEAAKKFPGMNLVPEKVYRAFHDYRLRDSGNVK